MGGIKLDFVNTNCWVDDGVDDTPIQKRKNRLNTKKVQDAEPSCKPNVASISNWQNFMDYSYDIGMFTNGQKIRMRSYILENKPKFFKDEQNITAQNSIQDSRDGKQYLWVQIGNQKWLTQNLNYKTQNSKCYDNKETNCTVYGRLYNWNDAISVCPTGWRLPNYDDWKQLSVNVGNNQSLIRSRNGWLKEKNGSNSSGLNILPSGYKPKFGSSSGIGRLSKIWLTNSNGNSAYSRQIGGVYGYDKLSQSGQNQKFDYLSCRCIQDDKAVNSSNQENNTPNSKTKKLYSRGGYPVKQKTQSNGNAKKLNNRTNSRTSQKKKGTTLKDLIKEN